MKNLEEKGVEMDSEKETERSHCFSMWKREGIKKDSMVGESYDDEKMQRQKRVGKREKRNRESKLDNYLI